MTLTTEINSIKNGFNQNVKEILNTGGLTGPFHEFLSKRATSKSIIVLFKRKMFEKLD